MLLCLLCEGLLTTCDLSSQAVCHLYRGPLAAGLMWDHLLGLMWDHLLGLMLFFCAYLRRYNVGQKSFLIVLLCHTAYNKSY